MIKFSQYLTEGRDAPLYRGLALFHLFDSLATGVMKARTQHYVGINDPNAKDYPSWQASNKFGISTTRNFNYARDWAMDTSGVPCVVEFDQRLLLANNKIVPFNYGTLGSISPYTPKINVLHKARNDSKLGVLPVGTSVISHNGKLPNEYEEFVLGDIKNIDAKINKIYLFSQLALAQLDGTPLEDDPRVIVR